MKMIILKLRLFLLHIVQWFYNSFFGQFLLSIKVNSQVEYMIRAFKHHHPEIAFLGNEHFDKVVNAVCMRAVFTREGIKRTHILTLEEGYRDILEDR